MQKDMKHSRVVEGNNAGPAREEQGAVEIVMIV